MSQSDPTPSPPAPATDHSHMFDDDPEDEPSVSQPAISLTPVRKNTSTLFLASPSASEAPDQRGGGYGRNDARYTDMDRDSDGEEQDRPSKKQRTTTQAPALTAHGRAPPRTALASTSARMNSETITNDPFADLDDLDYNRRAPARFDGDGEDDEDDVRNAQTQSRNNVVRGEDLLDPMNMRRMRGNGDGDDPDPEPKTRRVMPKLDADRLLSERGLPKLVEEARNFKIKGKGHEASDLNNLLTMYQFWAHQMFPKSTFGETTARVENLCHSKLMKNAMNKYYDEERLAREALLRSPSPFGSPIPDAAELAERGRSPSSNAPGGADVQRRGHANADDDDDMDLDAMIAQAEAEAMEYGGEAGGAEQNGRAGGNASANTVGSMPSMDEDDEEAMRGMELDMDFDAEPTRPGTKEVAAMEEQNEAPKEKVSLWGGGAGDDGDEEDWEALDAMES